MYASSPEQRRAAKARELAATLYSEHYRELYRLARRHGAPWIEPDEAVQEAFAAFLASYDPEGGSPPLAWLGLTLRRLCWALRERRRHAARLGATADGLGSPDEPWWRQWRLAVAPENVPGRVDRVRETRAAMEQLQPEQRRAISLLAIGYTYEEIADLTGLTTKQVDHRLQNTRTALRAASA